MSGEKLVVWGVIFWEWLTKINMKKLSRNPNPMNGMEFATPTANIEYDKEICTKLIESLFNLI